MNASGFLRYFVYCSQVRSLSASLQVSPTVSNFSCKYLPKVSFFKSPVTISHIFALLYVVHNVVNTFFSSFTFPSASNFPVSKLKTFHSEF